MSTPIPHHAEPQQNELAQWYFNFQRKIEPHTNKIILAIILGTITLVAYQVLARSTAAKTAEAWSKYAACTSGDDFKEVADDHPGSPVEAWSRLEAARNYIHSGVLLSMTNRKASDESLENGKAQLEKLLTSQSTTAEVREQALSQMAVCQEALCDGDVKPAIKAFERLLEEFPEDPTGKHGYYALWAKHRLEELKKPETGEFYAWFRKAKPAPPEPPKPRDVKPGEEPNIKLFPDEIDPLTPGTSGTAPVVPETKPADGTPVAPSPQPAEGSTPPKTTPPAEGAQPVGEKPADAPAAPTDKPADPAAKAPTDQPAEPAPNQP
jgi:predicted negative regulator of RcsB-dependent stress response